MEIFRYIFTKYVSNFVQGYFRAFNRQKFNNLINSIYTADFRFDDFTLCLCYYCIQIQFIAHYNAIYLHL